MTSLIIAARPSVVTHSNKSTSAAWVQVSTRATGRKGRPFESRIVRHSNPQHRMSALGQKWASSDITEGGAAFGFPHYFSALIYIKAKSQENACLHCTEANTELLARH